jgi:hypothetical protein
VFEASALFAVAAMRLYAGIGELTGWLRRRARLRRATAMIVGLHEPASVDPGNLARAPIYRFTTDDGRIVDACSSVWAYPPPKVGKRVTIAYDPADPQASAETVRMQTFKALVIAPIVVIVGLVLTAIGLSYL